MRGPGWPCPGTGSCWRTAGCRLTGTGAEVLSHPEIGALYLGGQPDAGQGSRVILDCHCHIIPAAMLAGGVPDDWRPAVGVQDGRQVVSFQGRRLSSVTGEFCDVSVMLGQAAAAGVTSLLLSPWILLLPVQADLATAARICRMQNDSLAGTAGQFGGRVHALGSVPLRTAAARQLSLST